MANPILKDDLISQEALDALERMSKLLHDDALAMEAMIRASGQYAGSLGSMIQQQQQDNAALQTYAERIENLENALAKMQKMMAENKATQAALNAEKRKYAKLTEEEANNVRSLAQGMNAYVDLIKKGNQVTLQNKELVDIQNKSYNELYQTYNALKDALNRMTTEERLNTEVGKTMTAQALKLRDTLNELQKSTGNYTLQVGKYRAAFDGLGYSMQQILREAPSALNLNQFFLAISNNVPMFLDQLKAFKDEQKEITENLKSMTEGTKEYAEQQAKQMSVGKKLIDSILSWQTAILVGLMLLRNYGSEVISWIGSLFSKTKQADDALKIFNMTMRDINREASEAVANASTELNILVERLDDVTKGTDEWRKLVERVNEITGETLDYQKTMPDEIKKVTKAYLDQMLTIEKNRQIVETLAKSQMGRNLVTASIGNLHGVLENDKYSPEDIVRMMGLDPKEQEELVKGIWFYRKFNDSPEFYAELLSRAMDAAGVLPLDVEAMLEAQYQNVGATKRTKGKGPKDKTLTAGNVSYRMREANAAIIEEMKVGYEREMALSANMREKSNDELTDWYNEQNKIIDENLQKNLISETEAKDLRDEIQREYDALYEKNTRDHLARVDAINTKYAEKDRQVLVEEEMNAIEMLDEAYKVQENNRKRRARTIKEEQAQNKEIAESISKIREEIDRLQSLNLTQPEAIEQRRKRIEQLTNSIGKLQNKFNYTKSLSNYGSFWGIFSRNGAFNTSTDMKKGILGSILGEDVVKGMSGDQIEGAFETWLDNVGQAVTTWYDTTMGYINDLIGAYVDLANAKAEAAKEATEAAQEEYEKEKALLEAGYASRVEATWAEYQEKKAAQEQAEKDAKAAAKAQQALNEVMTVSNLIVAAANLYKVLSALGPIGIAAATVAVGGMFAAFVDAKSKAYEVSKYGEGGFEVLEGGSHASGHDIDLGVNNRRGRRMHVEGKEGLGIFRVKAMQHYGADAIENVVNGINHLEYEQSVGRTLSLQRDMGLHNTMILPRTNLHRLESGVDKLVAIGSNSRHYEPDGTEVITTASGTTRIRRR